ncbi:MAG: response regulator [Anaerolineae bacterium]|nr:response regulator [Anaerolineae bacterium]
MRGQYRILIVDDDDNILRNISRMLRDYSASIDTATNNPYAFTIFQQMPYDLAILDMNMPDFDGEPNALAGINLLKKLRTLDDTLPVIILTGEEEVKIKTMLKASDIKNVDIFLKNSPGAGDELYDKVKTLLNESEVSILATGESRPNFFKRKDFVNLQGVVSSIESDHQAKNGDEGHIFIIEGAGVSPSLLDRHWPAKGAYGKLRAEPVDIIGIRNNKFVVIGSNHMLFLHDFYRNKVLVHKNHLKNLVGKVVEVKDKMNRLEVRITSSNAPEYLTSKRSWQAVTDDDTLLPLHTEVDILGEKGGKLRVRPHQTMILNEQGQEVPITEEILNDLIGKVVKPIDEADKGTILIISEQASDAIKNVYWQAIADDELIFIPGENVKVAGVKEKKLLIREYIA